MELRVTSQVQVSRTIANVRRQTDALANLQQQASSGIRLAKPSDDPLDVGELLQNRSQDLRLGAYQSNVKDSQNTLNGSVSSLLEASNLFTRAKQIAVEGANAATTDSGFEPLAQEVDELLNRLVGVANAQSNGRAQFGGTATGQDPFVITSQDLSGRPLTVAYRGANENASAPIGTGQTVDTYYAGNNIFQKAGADAFQALIGLRDDLRAAANSPGSAAALTQRVGDLDKAQNALLDGVGAQSASLENLEALDTRISDLKLSVQSRAGDLESADIAEVALKLQEQNNLFQSTLATAGRLFNLNLFDYLR
jgi:flagellar hook-associated protein 3 FlgL